MGGSAILPYEVAKYLSKKGHNVTIFTSDYKRNIIKFEEEETMNIVEASVKFVFKNFFYTPNMMKNLEMYKKNVDILHFHNFRSYQNIIACKFAQNNNIPYILQAHGSIPRNLGKGLFKYIFDIGFGYNILKKANMLVAINKYEYNSYCKMDINEKNILLIPNGLDLSKYKQLPNRGSFRKKYKINKKDFIILYLGRINHIKGLDLLINAFNKIEIENIKLIIVGPDDGYLNKLRSLINKSNNVNRITYIGPLFNKDKIQAYVDSDVYVLPSKYEIWGITVLEAMACGLPVIVTKNCGIAEYIEKDIGYVINRNENELINKITFLYNNKKNNSENINHRISFVENFNILNIVKLYENLYNDVLK